MTSEHDDRLTGRRARRRAATVREIIDAAEQLLGRGDAFSLRAVAGQVGMTVQALYHYFDSRTT